MDWDSSPGPFYLNDVLVMPALNRIRSGDETVQVEPRVMMVLLRLAASPGDVVSRDSLLASVWSGTVVCEEALTRTISELRRIFRDDAKAPRVIETIRKSGYRLVPPVTPATGPIVEGPTGNGSAVPEPFLTNARASFEGSEPFVVGAWLVEPELNRLVRDDDVARLEPRVMQVLRSLAERPGEVITRAALQKRVWPDGEVHETTISGAVSDLRRVFEEEPDAPRYIETIRGVGYCLVAPVHPVERVERAVIRGARPRTWMLGVAALLALSVLTAALIRGGLGDERIPDWRIRPLTTFPGTEYSPALSPDGAMLAFSRAGEAPGAGSFDLYVLQIDTGTSMRLTFDDAHDLYPAWSPDGSTVAYAAVSGDSARICSVPVLGGEPRRLAVVAAPVGGLDWSPDGHVLALAAPGDTGTMLLIQMLDLTTLLCEPLDIPHSSGDDTSPRFSPDGRTLAFVREESYSQQTVLRTRLGSGTIQEVTGLKNRVAGMDWLDDDELILSASNLVDYDLWLADLTSGRRTWLSAPGRPAISPTVLAGGSRLVYGELACDCDVWSAEVAPGHVVRPSDEPLIASTRMDYDAVASPDGTSIAFLSDRSGRIGVWIANADGTSARPLNTPTGSYVMNPCWSPDGKRIAYSGMDGAHLRLFVADAENGVARPVDSAATHELLLHWSSDDWLYVRRQHANGWDVRRVHPDGSDEGVVSRTGLTILSELSSGDLLCRRDGEPGLWRMPHEGGELSRAVANGVTKDWSGVAAADGGLFFVRRGGVEACLGFYDWASARAESLASIPADSGMLSLSADGTRLLWDCTTDLEIDLMLAEIGS